jgi:hypothetical protein
MQLIRLTFNNNLLISKGEVVFYWDGAPKEVFLYKKKSI